MITCLTQAPDMSGQVPAQSTTQVLRSSCLTMGWQGVGQEVEQKELFMQGSPSRIITITIKIMMSGMPH